MVSKAKPDKVMKTKRSTSKRPKAQRGSNPTIMQTYQQFSDSEPSTRRTSTAEQKSSNRRSTPQRKNSSKRMMDAPREQGLLSNVEKLLGGSSSRGR